MEVEKRAVIQVVDCTHSYDLVKSSDFARNSFEDVNLSVMENDFVAIIGQNGCGKSSLLKNICGLLKPVRGEIFIGGKNQKELSVSAISREIGFVMQNPDAQLFSDTVYGEVSFALRNLRLGDAEIKYRTEEAMSLMGITGQRDAFPLALNRGDRKKTVIAAVLAMGCRTIVLDEPDANQDNYGSCLIMDALASLNSGGYTIVFVTHNMSLAAEYSNRVIVMSDKRIRMDGSPQEVFYRADELSSFRLLSPQIARLSIGLQKKLPVMRNGGNAAGIHTLCIKDFADALLRSKK
ncbi:MAG: energy-coupling factor ABC transporter ATP-binding protein [Spirochaetes bacterium]|nr:energy-coupling factor ABC transporter ATP-binding protein [Spirochaetota bacterium]